MREQHKQQAHLAGAAFPKRLTGYDVIGLIGEGATARVYLCEPRGLDGKLYAMKVMCKADVDTRGKRGDVERERKLLQLAAGHPFVLNTHAWFESEHFEYLVLDHCAGSDLFEVQGTFPNQRMSENDARFYFTEVMLGCECIHDLGFVIRDLKPENVLIDNVGHCRVSDFDLAIEKDRPPVREPLVGTAEYISPEILSSIEAKTPKGTPGPDAETCDSSTVNEAADVWVLGLMLFEMLHGYSPFSKRANETIASCRQRIMDADNPEGWVTSFGKVKMKPTRTKSKKKAKRISKSASMLMIKIGSEAKGLISLCLAADPTRRPRVIALREHKWLKGTNWSDAMARKLKPPWVPDMLTPSAKDLLRQTSKEERMRRGSIDRPGWCGHSVLADQEQEGSQMPEQLSSDGKENKSNADPTPPRGPSRISGDAFEGLSKETGSDASHEMMIAMYALKFAANAEARASVGSMPVPGAGRFMGTSFRDQAIELEQGAEKDPEQDEREASPSSISTPKEDLHDDTAAHRPRGLSEPTTTLPPTTSPDTAADGSSGDTVSFVPQRRKPSDIYTNLAQAEARIDEGCETAADTDGSGRGSERTTGSTKQSAP